MIVKKLPNDTQFRAYFWLFYDSGKAGRRQAPHRSDSEIFFKIEAAKVPVRAKAKAASLKGDGPKGPGVRFSTTPP